MKVPPPKPSVSEPVFLEFNGRRLFAIQVSPTQACTGSVLYLPPFAEEMNRCRSHVAAQARILAGAGYRCLLLDPHGTGESDGQITDGDWTHWLEDAEAAGQWLVGQTGRPLTVWGVRTGALLAADLVSRSRLDVAGLLFWQPVIDGKQFLGQYLRLRIASQMVHDTGRETSESIRKRLAAGESIEVAGYPLTARLADSLTVRHMKDFQALQKHRVDWIEIASQADQALAPPSRRMVDALVAGGARINTATVAGPMIWQLQQRAEAPELLQVTLGLLGEQR